MIKQETMYLQFHQRLSVFVKYILILIFIVVSFTIIKAQSASLKFNEVSPTFLGDANLENIFFSKSGKMWFASSRGLASFDGSQVTYYNTAAEAALFGNTLINCMAEDSKGNLWIGTNHKGVNYFHSGTGKFTKVPMVLEGDSVERRLDIQHIYVGSGNDVWIATTFFGFFIYDPVHHTIRHFNLDNTKEGVWQNRARNTPNYFARDPHDSNKIWIGAFDGIYSCHITGKNLKKEFNVPTGTAENESVSASFCRIQQIHLPGNDTIWFSTWGNGMGYCDIRTGNTELFPNNENETNPRARNHIIVTFLRKSPHEYYIVVRNYLPAVFNTHTRQYHYLYDEDLEKAGSFIYEIVAGDNNTLWISKGGGLFFHSPFRRLFKSIDVTSQHIPDIRTNLMRDIFWDEQSRQYIASVDFSSGIFILDSLLRVIKVFNMPLNPPGSANTEASVWKTVKDGSGRLWALGDIFSVMPEKEEKFIPAYKQFSHLPFLKKRFDDCAVDDKNNLLLLSGSKIYIIYHDDLHADSIELNKNLISATLDIETKIFFDKARKLLYASGPKAIYQYNPVRREFRYLVYDTTRKNSLPQDLIPAFALDRLGNIWVSSAQFGIRVYEPVRLDLIRELTPENSGLPPNAELKNGGEDLMLIAANSGLFVYDITRNSFVKLTRENGMKNNLSWGYSIANNILFLGMRDTIQYVPVEKLNSMRKPIIPYISGVKVSGYPLRSDSLTEYLQLIKLNHRQRTISIEFSAIEFEFPERIRYAYRLEGLDEQWNFTDNFNRTITYSNLSSGKYIFRVKAQFQRDDNTAVERKLHIIITPPIWEAWWFRLLLLVIVAALLGTIINYRIRQIRKKAWAQNQLRELEMKALKAQMNPHFIYNALNSIQALVLGKKNSEASVYIGTFGRLLRQVLSNSDKTVISLENELQTLELYIQLEQLRMNMDLKYTINMSDEVNADDLMVPPLIFQPFVENALWHGLSSKHGEKEIIVNLSMDNGWLKATIEDNGIGRTKATEMKSQDHSISPSKGIEITTRRLSEFNRTLSTLPVEISDLYDEALRPAGTRIIINIKSADQY